MTFITKKQKSKKAADTFKTDVDRFIFMSTPICHRDMLLLLPAPPLFSAAVCKLNQLWLVSTHSLWHVDWGRCVFSSLTLMWYSGFLDSISLIFSAHWGNPDKPTGQQWVGGHHCVYVSVCNGWVMSGGKDWLLPPSVPTSNVWTERGRKTKRDRNQEKVGEERPHGPRFVFCLSDFYLHVQLHN